MIFFFKNYKNNELILKKKYILIILIILLIFKSYYLILFRENEIQIENQIIQYNKQKNNNTIIKYYYEKEIPKIKKYVSLLRKGYIKNVHYYHKYLKPKISFISTVYNKEKYLKSFICSIQNQNLKQFELIIVDDCSTDRSVEIIKNISKKDLRIKLILNKKNRGSLYSRYKGAIYSKGKYISFVDSDDIILKEGLSNSYNYIKKNNLDMIQFNSVLEINHNISLINRGCYLYSSIIHQPILSYIFYYENYNGLEKNYNLWDKLIKKQILFKSLRFIGKRYLYKKIIIENDVVILFALFRNSNSFQYIDELGYYYFCSNSDSITNTRNDSKKANQIIYSIFSSIEFLYDKTENTKLGKYFCIFKLKQGYYRYRQCFKYSNDFSFQLVTKVINKLLESNYISLKNKNLINNISSKIIMNRKY